MSPETDRSTSDHSARPAPEHAPSSSDARAFAESHAGATSLGVPSLVWGPGQDRRVRLIQERIPLAARRILDVGCGVGAYVQHLRALPATVYGLDVELYRVQDGGRTVPGLLVGAAEWLPFADASFDVVILNEVLEHVRDERATLQECTRVLPVGGHLVIYAPNRGFPFETHGIMWRGRHRFGNYPLVNYLPRRWRDRLVPHARVYQRSDLRRLLLGLPYEVRHESAVYPAFDGIRSRHARLGRALQAALHRAERTPLRALGLSHFLVLERVGETP